MIVVLSRPDDVHADRVEEALRARGTAYVRFDPALFPARARVVLRHGRAGLRGSLAWDDVTLDLDEVGAVWLRRPGTPAADPWLGDGFTARAVEELSAAVLADLWGVLDRPWVPAPPHVVAAAGKPRQLVVACAAGFDVPETLVANDPASCVAFYREHDGDVVSKVPAPSRLTAGDSPFCRYTEPVTPRDIGYADAVRYCPTVFQEYVAKQVEVRVTVVGEAVFAAEIDSQGTNRTRHDWRRYDHQRTRYAAHDLPAEVAARCRDVVRAFGLRYGAVDLVRTPDGRYVFLEVNPNGQYLWVEEATGLPITAAMADLLATLDARAAVPA